MRNKIPPEAFRYYLDLGPARTYSAVAAHYGVSLRGVTKRAVREKWKDRLVTVEAEARSRVDTKAVEDVAAVDERHLKLSRVIQSRALETLKNASLGSGAAAVRALDVAIRIERAILGREKENPATTRVQLITAANELPQELVDAALAWMRKSDEEKAKAKAAAAAPVVPPVLAPRVFGEN